MSDIKTGCHDGWNDSYRGSMFFTWVSNVTAYFKMDYSSLLTIKATKNFNCYNVLIKRMQVKSRVLFVNCFKVFS